MSAPGATPAGEATAAFKRGFPYWHETVLLGLLVLLMVAARIVEPVFASVETQIELSRHIWELAILVLPMTLIIITAGIDLSVGPMMALSAVVLGITFKFFGWHPALAAVAALLTGLAAGALNGFFIAWARVHPLIVTLATMAAYYGIAVGISQGDPLSNYPDSLRWAGDATLFGLPVAGLIFIVCAIAAAIVLGKMPVGRYLYAMGHQETAARFSGIPVARIKIGLYALSGLAAAVAGILFVGRMNTANADISTGVSLDVITAVVLGGTSIFGGRGRIIGTLLGVLLIHETREFVSWHWNKSELNLVVIGLLLIVSVLLNAWLTPRRRE
jgi:rhamnose transport system permease protein